MKIEPLPVEFLIAKGECCGSGCVYCPYMDEQGRRHVEGSKIIDQLLPLEKTKTPEELEIIAQKLRETDLFVWKNDEHKMLDKQGLFLLAAGYKQAYHTVLGHMVQTSETMRTSVPDDPEAPAKFLEELGFVYEIHTDTHSLDVCVARDKESLERSLHAKDSTEAGRLFGYPETAVTAFAHKELLLSNEEQDKFLEELCPDKEVRELCMLRLSKAHYKEEFETVKQWYKILKQYNLLDSQNLHD